MKSFVYTASLLLLFASCRRTFEAPIPDLEWAEFTANNTIKLQNAPGQRIQGVYNIQQGADNFGTQVAAKWSYTITGVDTIYHLSLFCESDVIYIICEGKRIDSNILLNGYWRRMIGTETGRIRLKILNANGGRLLLNTLPITSGSITITGVFGNGDAIPDQPISMAYSRRLNPAPFEIVAHRGGGRTSDLLPASENSVEIIKLASRFGATGIEIDVKRTSDGQLILYHDENLNERLIQKNGMVGTIESYTYTQLFTLVRLINGERIPTLRQALDVVLYNTPLQYVWLDTKYDGGMQPLRNLQAEYLQKAAAIGRNLVITIGIPDADVLENFKQLPSYQNIPSLNELTRADVTDVNSVIWAPRFTLGLQNDEVMAVQAEGRRAFVWTLDLPANIKDYISNGRFNGILSNYPSAVAFYNYAKQ